MGRHAAIALLGCLACASSFVITPRPLGSNTVLPAKPAKQDAVVFDSEGEFSLKDLTTDPEVRLGEQDVQNCFLTGECEVPEEKEREYTKAFNQLPYKGTSQTMTVFDGDSEHEEPMPWANKWSEVDEDLPVEAYQNSEDPDFDI